MRIEAQTVEEYISKLPEDRKDAILKLREVITKNIPAGFQEEMNYGMIGYVVPHSVYPAGYHCNRELPVPFMNIASQKNFMAVYHMAVYSDKELNEWFIAEYPKHSKRRPDMGKSCIRFKKPADIPFELIGELASKITPEKWIEIYENNIKPAK
ncbi:MAG: DUF1801 domain-containing protein [Bacteroidetes bacterium]|nr:MAG: DUF1801 domain-containing protein [Bacteroidota bacterium]